MNIQTLLIAVPFLVLVCGKDEEFLTCNPGKSFRKTVQKYAETAMETEFEEFKKQMSKLDTDMKSGTVANDKRDSEMEQLKERIRSLEEKVGIQPLLNDCPKSGSSGSYTVYGISYPQGLKVYCDTKTDGGGWTVFQLRKNGKLNFDRGWNDYVNGFGKLSSEFWMGFDSLKKILSSGEYELRVDLWDWEGNTAYALYRTFSLGDASNNYKLTVDGFSGTAGDSLSSKSGMGFTTKDKDNDGRANGNCAESLKGGWWFTNCNLSHLNGKYYDGGTYGVSLTSPMDGASWYSWKNTKLYSMKRTEMKIRLLQ